MCQGCGGSGEHWAWDWNTLLMGHLPIAGHHAGSIYHFSKFIYFFIFVKWEGTREPRGNPHIQRQSVNQSSGLNPGVVRLLFCSVIFTIDPKGFSHHVAAEISTIPYTMNYNNSYHSHYNNFFLLHYFYISFLCVPCSLWLYTWDHRRTIFYYTLHI